MQPRSETISSYNSCSCSTRLIRDSAFGIVQRLYVAQTKWKSHVCVCVFLVLFGSPFGFTLYVLLETMFYHFYTPNWWSKTCFRPGFSNSYITVLRQYCECVAVVCWFVHFCFILFQVWYWIMFLYWLLWTVNRTLLTAETGLKFSLLINFIWKGWFIVLETIL